MNSLLTILVLGFLLGMRHATDPDHVIAVGTIVARHQTTRAAALGIRSPSCWWAAPSWRSAG